MERTEKSCAFFPRIPATFLLTVMACGLMVLAGCATGGKAKVEPQPKAGAVATEPAPRSAGSDVERLTGSREGFVIRERSSLDGESRAEFDQAVALVREEKYEKGAELLERVIARLPGVTAPRVNAAIAYSGMKKPEQAEPHLKSALELVPGHPVASNEYGLLLRKAGRFAEARAVYEKSLAAFPEYHPLERNLAILCDLYLKDLVCAREHYELYSKAAPKDKQVTLWLADLQSRTGHLAMHAGPAQ